MPPAKSLGLGPLQSQGWGPKEGDMQGAKTPASAMCRLSGPEQKASDCRERDVSKAARRNSVSESHSLATPVLWDSRDAPPVAANWAFQLRAGEERGERREVEARELPGCP